MVFRSRPMRLGGIGFCVIERVRKGAGFAAPFCFFSAVRPGKPCNSPAARLFLRRATEESKVFSASSVAGVSGGRVNLAIHLHHGLNNYRRYFRISRSSASFVSGCCFVSNVARSCSPRKMPLLSYKSIRRTISSPYLLSPTIPKCSQ